MTPRLSRPVATSLAVLLLIALLVVYWVATNLPSSALRTANSDKSEPSRADRFTPLPSAAPPAPPFAARILEHYAEPARPPEEDLHDIARALGNFALLMKGDNPLPLGVNEEIATALRGKNRAALRALPDDHRAFNARGQLVDRWDTPLYFHAESRDRLDVRSAGPDRKMWTDDDLHRKHDGRFLRGEALLAPSVYDEKGAGR